MFNKKQMKKLLHLEKERGLRYGVVPFLFWQGRGVEKAEDYYVDGCDQFPDFDHDIRHNAGDRKLIKGFGTLVNGSYYTIASIGLYKFQYMDKPIIFTNGDVTLENIIQLYDWMRENGYHLKKVEW